MNIPKTSENGSAATAGPVCSTLSNTCAVVSLETVGEQWTGSENRPQPDGFHGQLVTCGLDELRPHPSYIRHHITVPASQLSALADLGDLAFREPIVITRDRIIIDGYARVELARLQSRLALSCFEYELTEAKALQWLLQRHRRSNGLNGFCRILVALELEPDFKEEARSNQQAGGQSKGSSKLTEAERLDVRSAIAAAAGASVGNVTKIKQLMLTAVPGILRALRSGEISIHKAWQWRELSAQQQLRALEEYRGHRGTNKTSQRLIQKHVATLSPNLLAPPTLADVLKPIVHEGSAVLDSIIVTEIDTPGNIAYLTKGALTALRTMKESNA